MARKVNVNSKKSLSRRGASKDTSRPKSAAHFVPTTKEPSPCSASCQVEVQLLRHVVKMMDPGICTRTVLHSTSPAFEELATALIGHTTIVSGPSGSGKTSLVVWAAERIKAPIVQVDCALYQTQQQFLNQIAIRIGQIVNTPLLRARTLSESKVDLPSLNPILNHYAHPIVIVIKNAERLIHNSKNQILLYTMLDWMKTEARKYVGLVFASKGLMFLEKLQKRVRSRMTGRHILMQHPSADAICDILLARLDVIDVQQLSIQGRHLLGSWRAIFSLKSSVRELIRQEQKIFPRGLAFYLKVCRMAAFHMLAELDTTSSTNQQSEMELQLSTVSSLEAKFLTQISKMYEDAHPYLSVNQHHLQDLTAPESIMMILIHRKCTLPQTGPLTLSVLYSQYCNFYLYGQQGSSFRLSRSMFLEAFLKLWRRKLVKILPHGSSSSSSFSPACYQTIGDIGSQRVREDIWQTPIIFMVKPEQIEAKVGKDLPDVIRALLWA